MLRASQLTEFNGLLEWALESGKSLRSDQLDKLWSRSAVHRHSIEGTAINNSSPKRGVMQETQCQRGFVTL